VKECATLYFYEPADKAGQVRGAGGVGRGIIMQAA